MQRAAATGGGADSAAQRAGLGRSVGLHCYLGAAAAQAAHQPRALRPYLPLQGALLLKHGRHGKPKVHYFRVTACDTLLRWRSAGGSLKQVGTVLRVHCRCVWGCASGVEVV